MFFVDSLHAMQRVASFHVDVAYIEVTIEAPCVRSQIAPGPVPPWLLRLADLLVADKKLPTVAFAHATSSACHQAQARSTITVSAGLSRCGLLPSLIRCLRAWWTRS